MYLQCIGSGYFGKLCYSDEKQRGLIPKLNMDLGDEIMGKYFKKKSGVIWAILTILLLFYIFWFILKELFLTFILVIVIGVIIWGVAIIGKRVSSK